MSEKAVDNRSGKRATRKHVGPLSAEEYGDDILTTLRKQWISAGHKYPDFDEFVSGFTIVKQFIEREGERNLRDKFKISGAELRILLALDRMQAEEGLRPTDLFRHLLISSGAVTKQLDRLEAREFVQRKSDPNNLRGFRVKLTSKGQKVVASIVGKHGQILPTLERLFDNFSKTDREHMLRLLHILTRGLQEATRDSPFD